MKHVISLFLSFLLTFNGVLGAGLSSGHQATDSDLCDAISKLQISGPAHSPTRQAPELEDKITTVVEFCAQKKADTIAYYLSCLPTPIRSLPEVRSELESAFDEVAYEYIKKEKEQPDSIGTLQSFKDVALKVMDQTLAELNHRYCPELEDHTAIDIKAPHSKANPGWFANMTQKAKSVLKVSRLDLAKVTKNIKHELRTNRVIVFSWVLCAAFLVIYIGWGIADIYTEQPVGTLILNLKNGVADAFWRPSGTVRLYDASVANASIGTFAAAHAHAYPQVLHRMMQAQSDPDGSGLLRVEGVMPLWLNQEAPFATTLGTIGDNLRHHRCDDLLNSLENQAVKVLQQRLGRLDGNVTCGLWLDDAVGRLKDCKAVTDFPPLNPGCNTSDMTVPQTYDGLVFFHYKKNPKGNIDALSVIVRPDPRYVTPTKAHTHTASLQALPSPSGTHTASLQAPPMPAGTHTANAR